MLFFGNGITFPFRKIRSLQEALPYKKQISEQVLYQIISSAFCVIVVLSNIISAKMVLLPYFELSIPAGLIIYPFTFFLSDLVTEFFGAKKAKLMVYTAFAMSLMSFALILIALKLPAASSEDQEAFQSVLELSGLRLFSSLTAYLISQIADIQLYSWIRRWTGPRLLWLRGNGSTCISQLIDTIIIDMIFLYWGLGMDLVIVAPIMVFSYIYKSVFSLLCTPLFYFCVFFVKRIKTNPAHLNIGTRPEAALQ